MPKDGLRMFAGPTGVCATVAVYEAAVVGDVLLDHGVSPRNASAKNAPLVSTLFTPPPLPVRNVGVAPVAEHVVVVSIVQNVAPVGVPIVSVEPAAPQVVGALGQKP